MHFSANLFLQEWGATQSWALHPLYAILHEAIYCQGRASLWAAQTVREVRCPPLHACHASSGHAGSSVKACDCLRSAHGVCRLCIYQCQ